MQTVIIPGFSINNKEWAEEAKREMDKTMPARVFYWRHWETGETDKRWIERESWRLADQVWGIPANIIAKSIGTTVALQAYSLHSEQVEKIILCGIPVLDFNPGDEKYYAPLSGLNPLKILIIQNENDNHGTFTQAEKFVHGINPNIKIISKPRSDHEYPYWDDFREFLK